MYIITHKVTKVLINIDTKKALTIVSALYSLVGALLNKVATEIALTCSNIDIYLPSMLKSAVK